MQKRTDDTFLQWEIFSSHERLLAKEVVSQPVGFQFRPGVILMPQGGPYACRRNHKVIKEGTVLFVLKEMAIRMLQDGLSIKMAVIGGHKHMGRYRDVGSFS